ncbi:MAG: hypothetical protein ACRD1H_16620, partial [Vicinamibacterales bacterium]
MATDPRDRIGAAINDGDDDALVAALRSGSHHGKPGVNAATKRWTAERLRQRDGDGSPTLLDTALRYSANHEPMLRSIACVLLARLWDLDRASVTDRAITLAADLDWEVREWAASIFGLALDSN